MNKEKLIIIGASGHGKVLADIAYKMGNWQDIFFLDDNPKSMEIFGFKVIGTSEDISKFKESADFIVGIGDNQTREKIFQQLEELNVSMATLIHPNATIGLDVSIGKGTAVMAGVVINSSTTIGKGVIANTNSSVDHDCTIANFVHLSPGVNIAGNVSIGDRTWLGIGSTVSNNLSVCGDIIIGAKSLVIRDIDIVSTYIGIPAIMYNK